MTAVVVDTVVDRSIDKLSGQIERWERLGFNGVWATETVESPLFPLLLAASSTDLDLVSAVSIAFARTPVALAYDIATVAKAAPGRLTVGLGSQLAQHIRKRFGMPWSDPAERMRDYVQALRAIWNTWQTGEPLNHRGPYYRHTLMPEFYSPVIGLDNELKLYVAAVGPRMAAVAAEEADGLLVHALYTPDYLRSQLADLDLPQGRPFDVAVRVIAVSAFTELGRDVQWEQARAELAFTLASPAYRRYFAAIGLTDLHRRLRRMALTRTWVELMAEVPDDVVAEFVVEAEPNDLSRAIEKRYLGLVDRICLQVPPDVSTDDDLTCWSRVVADLRKMPRRADTSFVGGSLHE